MPNKTIYVKESDLPLWEQAQTELGVSLSSLFAEFLQRKLTVEGELHVMHAHDGIGVMFGRGDLDGPMPSRWFHTEPELERFLTGLGLSTDQLADIAAGIRQKKASLHMRIEITLNAYKRF